MDQASHPHRIDTHHHIFSPTFMAREKIRLKGDADRFAGRVLEWTPAKAIEAMDQGGIATAITSITAPGIWTGDAASTRALARECNEFAAQMARDHKGRFGVFAALPVPDVDASLREIAYAFDVLKVDGIGLVTNFADLYPGDPSVAPIFDELNRRKTVVYFHPTATDCCANLLPGTPAPLIEFAFDTTRAIVSLLLNGTIARCPDIKFIFSHGGGTIPMLAGRIAGIARTLPKMAEKFPGGLMPEFRKLYYDTVSLFDPIAFAATRALVGNSQLLFGTDFPYWDPAANIDALAAQKLEPQERAAIERNNALGLFPRFG